MEQIYYWLGFAVFWVLSALVFWVFIVEWLFVHLAGVTLHFYALIKTDSVKAEWKKKYFWRLRIVFHLLKSDSYTSCTALSNDKFCLNFERLIPRLIIYDAT